MTALPPVRRPPPAFINVNFGSQWNIISPFVYRYENKEWIEKFFEDGSLRISSFKKFSEYPDEIRGDRFEGSGLGSGLMPDGKEVIVSHQQGTSAYVLSCSHRLDRNLQHSFQRDGAFEILNVTAFSYEVARQLQGFSGGFEGSCIYRSSKNISRNLQFKMDDYVNTDGSLSMKMMTDASEQLGGPELMLLKTLEYSNQAEYRLLWQVDQMQDKFIDIKAPNARNFCRKVDEGEY